MTIRACSNCRFWYVDPADPVIGLCRRNAPAVVPWKPEGAWPRTDHDLVCGQHEPAPEPPCTRTTNLRLIY